MASQHPAGSPRVALSAQNRSDVLESCVLCSLRDVVDLVLLDLGCVDVTRRTDAPCQLFGPLAATAAHVRDGDSLAQSQGLGNSLGLVRVSSRPRRDRDRGACREGDGRGHRRS